MGALVYFWVWFMHAHCHDSISEDVALSDVVVTSEHLAVRVVLY